MPAAAEASDPFMFMPRFPLMTMSGVLFKSRPVRAMPSFPLEQLSVPRSRTHRPRPTPPIPTMPAIAELVVS